VRSININIPLLSLLLQGIPEQIAVVTLACVIAGIPLDVKKIIAIGIILAGCAYVVRLFPVPFGVHSILLTVILFIALVWLSKGDLSLSIIACLLSYLTLAVLEFVCLLLLMPIFGITPEVLSTDLVMRIILAEPQVLLLFILSFTLNIFFLKKVNKELNNEV
jgi:hypothetical protein